MKRLTDWIRATWNEESNVGKAKLAVIAVLLFILIAALLPDAGRVPLGVPVDEIERESGMDADAARQAAEAYRGYEMRIGELERERQELQNRLTEAEPIEQAGTEAAEAYRGYEARIAELEQEKRELARKMIALEAGGAAADAAQQEPGDQPGAGQASRPYGVRIAELERENRRLLEQLAERDRHIAALEQGVDPAQATANTMELRLQLLALRANLNEVLRRLGEAEAGSESGPGNETSDETPSDIRSDAPNAVQ
ncbi:MAG: hypothetical protein WCZ87_05515 [Thiohalobacteraceae bacterium]